MEKRPVCTLIQELLVKNERVLLPGTGTLVIKSAPASFMQDGKTILPPSKKLLFKNDIMEGEYELWQEELSGKIKEAFAQHRDFDVQGVGIFSQNEDGETIFTPNEDFDFAPDNFTLEAISLEVNEVETAPKENPEVPVKAEQQEENEVVDQPQEEVTEQEVQPQEKTAGQVDQKPQEEVKIPEPVIKKPQEAPVTEKKSNKWIIWTLAILGTVVLLVLLAIIFKENLKPLLENLLYSEEELEIIQKWTAQ